MRTWKTMRRVCCAAVRRWDPRQYFSLCLLVEFSVRWWNTTSRLIIPLRGHNIGEQSTISCGSRNSQSQHNTRDSFLMTESSIFLLHHLFIVLRTATTMKRAHWPARLRLFAITDSVTRIHVILRALALINNLRIWIRIPARIGSLNRRSSFTPFPLISMQFYTFSMRKCKFKWKFNLNAIANAGGSLLLNAARQLEHRREKMRCLQRWRWRWWNKIYSRLESRETCARDPTKQASNSFALTCVRQGRSTGCSVKFSVLEIITRTNSPFATRGYVSSAGRH